MGCGGIHRAEIRHVGRRGQMSRGENTQKAASIFERAGYVDAFYRSRHLRNEQIARYVAALEDASPDRTLQSKRIVDLGAGVGRFARPFARAVGEGGHVIALDASQAMCEQLTQSAMDESLSIKALRADFSDLVTQPPDPGRELVESVRLSFWVDVVGQGPVSGACA